MKLYRFAGLALAVLPLSACMMSSSKVAVKSTAAAPTGPKVVAFLAPTPYLPEMTEALAEHGFTVKAMASQQYVTETQGAGKVAQYNEAATRYGLTLTAAPTTLDCVLTSHSIYNFTLLVTDIQRNEIVLVLRQKGSDGPCTTIKPVFPTLAASLGNAWR